MSSQSQAPQLNRRRRIPAEKVSELFCRLAALNPSALAVVLSFLLATGLSSESLAEIPVENQGTMDLRARQRQVEKELEDLNGQLRGAILAKQRTRDPKAIRIQVDAIKAHQSHIEKKEDEMRRVVRELRFRHPARDLPPNSPPRAYGERRSLPVEEVGEGGEVVRDPASHSSTVSEVVEEADGSAGPREIRRNLGLEARLDSLALRVRSTFPMEAAVGTTGGEPSRSPAEWREYIYGVNDAEPRAAFEVIHIKR